MCFPPYFWWTGSWTFLNIILKRSLENLTELYPSYPSKNVCQLVLNPWFSQVSVMSNHRYSILCEYLCFSLTLTKVSQKHTLPQVCRRFSQVLHAKSVAVNTSINKEFWEKTCGLKLKARKDCQTCFERVPSTQVCHLRTRDFFCFSHVIVHVYGHRLTYQLEGCMLWLQPFLIHQLDFKILVVLFVRIFCQSSGNSKHILKISKMTDIKCPSQKIHGQFFVLFSGKGDVRKGKVLML